MSSGNLQHPMVILLVEDDAAHAEIVQRNLEYAPVIHRMMHVEDGQTALDYLDRAGGFADPLLSPMPDLVLLDLRLPRVDGLEVLQHIRATPRLRKLPVVVLTTSDAEADLMHAYHYGVGSYLVKPVSFEGFSELLRIFGSYWLVWNRYPRSDRFA